MTPQILEWMLDTRKRLQVASGRVLEVGSRDVNGTARWVLMDAVSWLGIDLEAGPGVDVVGDAEVLDWTRYAGVCDTVVCCETLEHVVHPWIVVEGMRACLRPGGHMWISTPTIGFPEHRYPVDCFRYLEDAYRLWIYHGWELLALDHVVDSAGGPGIVAVGRKPV